MPKHGKKFYKVMEAERKLWMEVHSHSRMTSKFEMNTC